MSAICRLLSQATLYGMHGTNSSWDECTALIPCYCPNRPVGTGIVTTHKHWAIRHKHPLYSPSPPIILVVLPTRATAAPPPKAPNY